MFFLEKPNKVSLTQTPNPAIENWHNPLMEQNILTIILAVKDGRKDALCKILESIKGNPDSNVSLFFSCIDTVHFARFVFIPSEDGQTIRLLFSACTDGSLEDLAANLAGHTGTILDDIFSHCEDYLPGTWKDVNLAMDFVRRRNIPPDASVIAFRGISLKRIQFSEKVRGDFEQLIDTQPMRDFVAGFPRRGFEPGSADGSTSSLMTRIGNWIIELFLGKPGGNHVTAVASTAIDLPKVEDEIAQNQMTIVSPNRPGIWLWTLKAVLALANSNAHRPGSLSGLPTIHFAQWTIIDGGRNLLFQSNYNGSWENYIDDFIDYAHLGLDLIWGHCPDYPEGGCRNIEDFKRVIRHFQHPAEVYYSAYPTLSVALIASNLLFAQDMEVALNLKGVARVLTGSPPVIPDWLNP